jgi:hypothetical protein
LHVLAYAEAQPAGAGAYNILNAVPDPMFNVVANRFQIPKDHWIFWMYASGATLGGARINNGSLRQRGFPTVIPFNTTLLPPNDPNVMDRRDAPIYLKGLEDCQVDTINNNAGAENEYVVMGVDNVKSPNFNINVDDLRWVRFSAALTAVALGWSNFTPLVFDDALESGQYGVFGLQVQGANIVAARLIFSQQAYRPGCLGQAALGSRGHEMFRGGLGLWGYFNTYSFPQIETLENAAGASTVVGNVLIGKIS